MCFSGGRFLWGNWLSCDSGRGPTSQSAEVEAVSWRPKETRYCSSSPRSVTVENWEVWSCNPSLKATCPTVPLTQGRFICCPIGAFNALCETLCWREQSASQIVLCMVTCEQWCCLSTVDLRISLHRATHKALQKSRLSPGSTLPFSSDLSM